FYLERAKLEHKLRNGCLRRVRSHSVDRADEQATVGLFYNSPCCRFLYNCLVLQGLPICAARLRLAKMLGGILRRSCRQHDFGIASRKNTHRNLQRSDRYPDYHCNRGAFTFEWGLRHRNRANLRTPGTASADRQGASRTHLEKHADCVPRSNFLFYIYGTLASSSTGDYGAEICN